MKTESVYHPQAFVKTAGLLSVNIQKFTIWNQNSIENLKLFLLSFLQTHLGANLTWTSLWGYLWSLFILFNINVCFTVEILICLTMGCYPSPTGSAISHLVCATYWLYKIQKFVKSKIERSKVISDCGPVWKGAVL